MGKPIIFLDFDGVLNTYSTGWSAYPTDKGIDPDKVERVHHLAKELDADIVISSAWRSVHSLEELRRMLRERGGLPSERVIDVTPDWKGPHYHRGEEIKEWLLKNKRKHDPFVILDDMTAAAFKGLEDKHVQTTLRDGFTEERRDAARQLLEKQREARHCDSH